MKRVYVMHEGKKYYWWFMNMFTNNRNKARLCSDCYAKAFVTDTKEILLVNEDNPVEITDELVIEDE